MNETIWTHLGIVALPTLMIVGFWLDSRRERRDQDRIATQRHLENSVKLAEIKTAVDPIVKWWNKNGS